MARGDWTRGPVDPDAPRVPMRLPPMPQVPARTIRLWLAIAAAVVLVFASYYQVEPDEVGVVQRFGAFVRTTEPGPT